MNFKVNKILIIIMAVICLITIGAVSAVWTYPSPNLQGDSTLNVGLSDFKWQGSEILPDDIEGEDHVKLVNNLLNGKDANGNNVGLNNPESDLNENINYRLNGGLWGLFGSKDYYGSMDGSILDNTMDMEGLFSTETLGLSFIIQVLSDTEYYIFTTGVELGARGAPNVPIGQMIYPVFRTKIVRENVNSVFEIVETKEGGAPSMYYEQLTALSSRTEPSFDIDRWQEMSLGQSVAQAINTFVGDNPTAYADDQSTPVYYRLKPKANGTVNVSCAKLSVNIVVYSSNGTTVLAQSDIVTDAQGVAYTLATFTATANQEYYIAVSGDTSISFNIN